MADTTQSYLFLHREILNSFDSIYSGQNSPRIEVIELLSDLYSKYIDIEKKNGTVNKLPLITFSDKWFNFDNFDSSTVEWLQLQNYGSVKSDNKFISSWLKSEDNIPDELRIAAFRLKEYLDEYEDKKKSEDKKVIDSKIAESWPEEFTHDHNHFSFTIFNKPLRFQSKKSMNYKVFTYLWNHKGEFAWVSNMTKYFHISAKDIRFVISKIKKIIIKQGHNESILIECSGRGEYRIKLLK